MWVVRLVPSLARCGWFSGAEGSRNAPVDGTYGF
jgi:hypothetical protein